VRMRRDSLFPEHSVLLFDKRLAHGEHCFHILLPIFLLLVLLPLLLRSRASTANENRGSVLLALLETSKDFSGSFVFKCFPSQASGRRSHVIFDM
jgi:hypothetical protein